MREVFHEMLRTFFCRWQSLVKPFQSPILPRVPQSFFLLISFNIQLKTSNFLTYVFVVVVQLTELKNVSWRKCIKTAAGVLQSWSMRWWARPSTPSTKSSATSTTQISARNSEDSSSPFLRNCSACCRPKRDDKNISFFSPLHTHPTVVHEQR